MASGRWLPVLLIALWSTFGRPAHGQTPRNCVVELVSAARVAQRSLGSGRFHQFASGNVRARCVGQATTVRTDSFAHYPEFNRADFSGDVRFRDAAVALDADRATYYVRDERIEAFGRVQLVNRASGSVLTGRRLTYRRVATGIRDVAELDAVNRPRVEYRIAGDVEEPYVIIGNRVQLKGNSDASVYGRVTIDRADFAAKSDSALLNLDLGRGVLYGNAVVESEDTTGYTLQGAVIAFRLVGGQLSWVQARDSANATSAEWQIQGDTIEFSLQDEQVQAASAWGGAARAVSSSYTIVADSLAVDLPNQVLGEVRGYGRSRAMARADTDSGDADWMAGDTLTVRFDEQEDGARTLSSLEARGNAQAFYRIYEAGVTVGPPGLNYSRGRVITARFRNQTLERVDVVGEADGIYLAPVPRRP